MLSGVSYEDGKIGAAYLERGGDYGYFADERIPGFYHGTGDVFASALVAAYVRGMSMSDAAAAAVRFTTKSIRLTAAAGSAALRRSVRGGSLRFHARYRSFR